jgi:polysaccharide export outer membrane protein
MTRNPSIERGFYMHSRTLVIALIGGAILGSAALSHANDLNPVITPWTPTQERVASALQGGAPDTEPFTDEIETKKYSGDVRQPSRAETALQIKTAPSALEKMYSARMVDNLQQYGYDLFGVPSSDMEKQLNSIADNSTPMGAAQDDFVLGIDDELEVIFTGQRTDRGRYQVNSQGILLIPDFPPIPAAGRTIGQVRVSVEAAANNLHNTQAYVSLSSVRQIGVLVVGHVKSPGLRTMTVFHTVLDALMQAGGVQKTGSLRQIKLVRDGRGTMIDLYALLLHGSTNMDLNLRDGDRIIIPAIGPTVAVAGEAKRTGIFEILPALQGMRNEPENTSEKLSLNEMLELGGGVMAPGKNRYLKLEVIPNGQEKVGEVADAFAPVFGDGAVLMVSKGTEKRQGTIELDGHTRRPGLHALDENPSLSALLASEDILGPDIYPLTGVIERWDEDQLTHKILDFPVHLVLKGEFDRKLQDGDVVHLFSNAQMRNLSGESGVVKPQLVAMGSGAESEAEFIDNDEIAEFLSERAVFVRGAVRAPSAYPVAEGATLDSVLAAAGGLTLEASTANIEVTSALQGEGLQTEGRSGTERSTVNLKDTRPEEVMIAPGDSVRVGQKFQKVEDKSVLIIGEVDNHGRYDLIDRAGGITNQGYPDGAIFSRDSERKAEVARFRAQAREMKQAIAVAIEADNDKIDAGKIAEARVLADELDNAEGIGRITVEADPAVLLESGDRIFIPKRTLNVRVRGEVLSPANLQFRENKDPLQYVHEAGGFTFHADKDRTFVLYPDGSAQPLQVSSWNHKSSLIPPG